MSRSSHQTRYRVSSKNFERVGALEGFVDVLKFLSAMTIWKAEVAAGTFSVRLGIALPLRDAVRIRHIIDRFRALS